MRTRSVVRREVEGVAPANVPLMQMARRPDRSRAAPLLGGALAAVAAGSLVVFSLLAQRAGLEAYRGPGVRAASPPAAASPVVVPGIGRDPGDVEASQPLPPSPDSDLVLADVEARTEVPADESDPAPRSDSNRDDDKPTGRGNEGPGKPSEPSPSPEPSFTPPRGSGGHVGSKHGSGHGNSNGNGPKEPKGPKGHDKPDKGPKGIPPGHAKAKGKGHHKHDHDHFHNR